MNYLRRAVLSVGTLFILATVAVVPVAAFIITEGTDGPDRLDGTRYQDLMWGYSGDDLIIGYAAGDALYGGGGNDRLRGGDGPDTLDGGGGNDRMVGGPHRDRLDGGPGDDTLIVSGDGSIDHVLCGGGFDVVYYDAEDIVADGCERKKLGQP